jgi:crotonobetainyl-CoA:carnitine CoA-transferase CaiB-like acyl-CoA transferase
MGILDGIRVIDLTLWAFAPSAGGILAHWGADVTKIENPKAPDPMRLLAGSVEPGGSSAMFRHYNRGKRAVCIDLSLQDGREILYKLVEHADVFLTSFLEPTRKKLGFDVDQIRAVNPSIVYARTSGQGPRGPDAQRAGYDAVTWWCRGTLADTTMVVSGAEWPTQMVGHGDGMSGMTLAGGICAALLKRERTGVPSVVDGSLLGTALWFNGHNVMWSAITDMKVPGKLAPPGDRYAQSPGSNTYRTSDGRFLRISHLGDHQSDWEELCENVGRRDLITDPRFATSGSRTANSSAAVRILDEVFAARTLREWKDALAGASYAWAAVQTPEEAVADIQTKANGFVRHVRYPDRDLPMPVPGGLLFDEDGGEVPLAPDFGEHTDEVLLEAGYSLEQLEGFRGSGVIR